MNKIIFAALAAALCASAGAQVVLYNGLGNSVSERRGDWDGGVNNYGVNYGGQAGQIVTDSGGATSITNIEAYFTGILPTTPSGATGIFVEVFNFAAGSVGSLVSSQTVGINSETDTANGTFGAEQWDIDVNTNLTGLVNGNQYLVVIQGQGPNWGFLSFDADGNENTYLRDFSNFGNGPVYGNTSWGESGALGYGSGDLSMKIEATPEPISMGVLALGFVAMLRRGRRA